MAFRLQSNLDRRLLQAAAIRLPQADRTSACSWRFSRDTRGLRSFTRPTRHVRCHERDPLRSSGNRRLAHR